MKENAGRGKSQNERNRVWEKPKYALLRTCDKCGKPQKPSKINPDSAWSLEYEPKATCECGGEFHFNQVPYAEYEKFMKELGLS